MIQASFDQTFEGWRNEARRLILLDTPPSQVSWGQEMQSLFAMEADTSAARPRKKALSVPPEFLQLAESISFARDEDRWDLLYRLLFRLQHENSNLLKISIDDDVRRAELLKKSISHDIHKLHAFVRFKKSMVNGEEVYVAWHRPEHRILRPGTPFFVRRFGDRPWSIFSPDESAHWDLENLTFGPGMPQNEFQTTDDWDEVWKTYYKSIFNPARIKIKMMKKEMAPKYWSSMPETALINELVREAPARLQIMAENQNRAALVDMKASIPELRTQAASCEACPLAAKATQTVFGVGDERAEIMIVGEQPGDQEDLAGQPFIGPAGQVLDEALEQALLNRGEMYLTNAVKHFKWIPQEKARLHQRASGQEMHACKPWLEAEIAQVKPNVIVALGVTAATAILGRLPKIGQERGKVHTTLASAPAVIVSWHPAAILRASTPEQSAKLRAELFADLQLAAKAAAALKNSGTKN